MTRLYETAIKGTHSIAGRRIRPTAAGLAIFAFALGLSSFQGHSLLQGLVLGQIIALMCVSATLFFTLGFILNRSTCAKAGYLLTFFTLNTQFVFQWVEAGTDFWPGMFTFARGTPSLWMGLGVTVIAGGSYWLEGFRE